MSAINRRLEKLKRRFITEPDVLGLYTPWFDGFNLAGEPLTEAEQLAGFNAAMLAYKPRKGETW